MSDNSSMLIHEFVTPEGVAEIDHWIQKYPQDEKQSAVMRALMVVQEQNGQLSAQSMDAVAQYLDMPNIEVYEVASFYSMYSTKPLGRHLINVCTNISCMLNHSSMVVEHLKQKLNVKLGETTQDGRFTLCSVECLGACVNAPMMQIDKDYHENLTQEKIDVALEQYS